MPWIKKLATIATAAEAARRYAKKNPDQAAKYLDQAAAFVDKQTKGRYKSKIDGVAEKVKGVAGVRPQPGGHAANGQYTPGTAGYSAPQPSATTTPPTAPTTGPTTGSTTGTGTPQAGSADKK